MKLMLEWFAFIEVYYLKRNKILLRRPMNFKIIFVFVLLTAGEIYPQEFIPIWQENKMPNSIGMKLDEIILNDRITQVSIPGIYAFFTSPEENKGCAVLICPGGGYQRLAYNISGFQIAKWFNTIGVTAFVLNYRLPTSPDLIEKHLAPLQDAQRAIRLIRANSDEWKIDPNKIGIMGTSAGGHLASTLATHNVDVSTVGDSIDNFLFHPNFQILISPVITMNQFTHSGSKNFLLGENPSEELIKKYSNELNVSSSTPPAFIVHAVNDNAVSINNSLIYHKALIDNNISASLHVFPQGGHSISLRNNPGSTNLWTTLCEMWMVEMGFIQ